jgi:mannosyltransferase OCH1-like enzyme
VHSNSLPHDTFDVLTEAGYSIKVASYDLQNLLWGSPAQSMSSHLRVARSNDWPSRKAELLRFLILHQQGGVYLDHDAVLVRSIDTLATNSLGWETNTNSTLSSTFMMFEKGHPYLKSCLEEFAKTYELKDYTASGSDILTKTWLSVGNSKGIHILPYHSFFSMIHSKISARQCFEKQTGDTFETNTGIIRKAYAAKIDSKFLSLAGAGNVLLKGTVCGNLLSDFCVLCSNVY